jgi:predicted nucleic acid-binding protein
VRAVLADTGPLYALVDRDDSLHRRARQEVRRIAEEGRSLAVPFPTLLESHSLVLRRLGIATSRRWLDELTSGAGFLNPHADDYLAASKRIASYGDQTITLFDGLLAVLADQLKLPVWTFDHHFDSMGVTVWR